MQKSNLITIYNLIIIIFYSCTVVNAHEFWIDPTKFVVKANEPILADLRVGQMMKGVSYGYYPRNFTRFEVKTKNNAVPLVGRIGDKPAINIPPQGDHLVTIIHSTTNSVVAYNEWFLFEKFLQEKNLTETLSKHLQKQFPKTQFKELYSRYAKSLIGSGNSSGRDQKVGLEVEIVLKENPYTEDITNGLTIELIYQGLPIINTQIEIFSRADDETVIRKTMFTNNLGQAKLQVLPKTNYMINSVIMRQPEKSITLTNESNLPILWESLWASTSFRIP